VSGMRAGLARVLRREVAAWKADRLMPWLLSVLPLAGVVLVLAIFAGRVSTDLPVAVVDRDDSAASRALVARLDATAGMRVASRDGRMADARRRVEQGRAYAVIAIPGRFEADLLRGAMPRVGVLLDQQSLSTANAIARDVQQTVLTFGAERAAGLDLAEGVPPSAAQARSAPLRVELHPLFNPGIDYAAYLGLFLVLGVLHIFVFLHGTRRFAAEHDDVGAAWRLAADGRSAAALAGKLLPGWIWWSVFGVLVLLAAQRWLDLPPMRAPWLYAIGWSAMSLAYLALGGLLATLAQPITAYSATSVLAGPALAFSGIPYPLAAMHALPRLYGEALPVTWMLRLQTQLVTERVAPAFAWPTVRHLALMALVLLALLAFAHARRERGR